MSSEAEYLLAADRARRKAFGQFFTPPALAAWMAAWVLASAPRAVLDPAFGLGAFHRAVRALAPTLPFTGVEIDPLILSHLDSAVHADEHLTLHLQDFLLNDVGMFDAIVCNPPYIKFRSFPNRALVQAHFRRAYAMQLPAHANTAALFLFKALRHLNPRGRLAFVMPFEFFNARYGTALKQILIEQHLLKGILLFENEHEIFPEALTTVCVLLCESSGTPQPIRLAQIRSLDALPAVNDWADPRYHPLAAQKLQPHLKWSPLLKAHLSPLDPDCADAVPLLTYGKFVRGLATGANPFFALSPSRVRQFHLSDDSLRPCLVHNAQAVSGIFGDAEWRALRDRDQPVYCLDAHDPLDQAARAYIQWGESQNYHTRYLTRTRDPWYRLESRQPAPILLGVFSRGRHKILRNHTACLHFTCFHSFFPNDLGAAAIDRLFLYLLSDRGQSAMARHQRAYGAGLFKLEPNDLNAMPMPSPARFDRLNPARINAALHAISETPSRAIEIANTVVEELAQDRD